MPRILEYKEDLKIDKGTTFMVVPTQIVKEDQIGKEAFDRILSWVKLSRCSYVLRFHVEQTEIIEQRG
jgi:hypothetical protein